MNLGNFTRTPNYVGDMLIGYTETSDDIKVGKHCIGATYNGKSVGCFGLNLDDINSPEMAVTEIQGKYLFSSHGGPSTLDDWEKLFEDTLIHIRSLKS